jgi:hypothetical protein
MQERDLSMISQRSTHYWLWFLLFGLVAGLAKGFDTEAIVVSATGILGVITGARALNDRLGRLYDLVVGLVFTGLGLLGILHSFPQSKDLGIVSADTILGLSLMIPYSLIHTVLGLTSLNHGFKPPAVTPKVTVATPTSTTSA